MPYKDPEKRRANARLRSRRHYAIHKAKLLALQKTPEGRAERAALARERRSKLPKDFYRNEWLKQRKNKELLAGRACPDVCDICGKSDSRRLHFDHCHKHGHFRGWICYRCNTVLDQVEDNVNLLRKLIAYLQRTKINTSPQFTLSGI